MLKRCVLALLPLCVLLAACSSKPKTAESPATTSGGFLLEPQHNALIPTGDFANNPAEQFIDKMVSKHGFDRQQLHGNSLAGQASGLRAAPDGQTGSDRPAANRPERCVAALSQTVYYPDNVQNGVAFWNQYPGKFSARSRLRRTAGSSSVLSALKPAGA
jgi:membrane-bound lytic murein transglycosylase B